MISAIIVNHNGGEHLRRCLERLQLPGPELEILIVDNASTDESLRIAHETAPDARILKQDRNLGFGLANNLAAENATGDGLLLINTDAWLEEQAVQHLHDRMHRNPRIGLVAPTLLYPDGRRQFVWSPKRSVLGEVMQQIRNRFESRYWAHGWLAKAVSRLAGRIWYTAACVLIRTEAFRSVGGFDERFFMYFEDVDLCLRLEAAGWTLAQERSAVVRHAGGFKRNSRVDDLYRPSQLQYYACHRPSWEVRVIEKRLRRRYGDHSVERWLRSDDNR